MTISVEVPVLTESVPSSKELSQAAELELYQSIRLNLCRWSASQVQRNRQKAKRAKARTSRESLLQGLDAQSLAETRKRILEYWPK
jgi:hypothetical protein